MTSAVGVFGELSSGALVAVTAAGAALAAVALARHAGAGSPPAGRPFPTVATALLAAAAVVELVALAHDDLPTFSDLLDPVLAHPLVRAAATAGWLAAGAWLAARPDGEVGPGQPVHRTTAARVTAAAMRTALGRLAVLVLWWWSGVHFLAR